MIHFNVRVWRSDAGPVVSLQAISRGTRRATYIEDTHVFVYRLVRIHQTEADGTVGLTPGAVFCGWVVDGKVRYVRDLLFVARRPICS